MRIVQVGNFQLKHYGRPKVSTERKLHNGFIRNNFQVLEFSDRDVAKYESVLKSQKLGRRHANRLLIQTCADWRPDLLMLGHVDLIDNATIAEIRRLLPAIRVAHRNVDPPFDAENLPRLRQRMDVVDALFVTTGGDFLKQFATKRTLVSYMPNPTDPAVEPFRNFERPGLERPALGIDLVFCGVGNPTDPRYGLVGRLHRELAGIRFKSFGMHGGPAIWGADYDAVLGDSKMGLNLNRQEGDYLYTSARMSQLVGNGILTFMAEANGYRRFMGDDQIAFFSDEADLIAKIRAFHADEPRRKAVAEAGWRFYHQHFSAEAVARYIVETTFGLAFSRDYLWQDQIYRG